MKNDSKFHKLDLVLNTALIDAWNDLRMAGVPVAEISARIDEWNRDFLAAHDE
jgi:hypothetical protein